MKNQMFDSVCKSKSLENGVLILVFSFANFSSSSLAATPADNSKINTRDQSKLELTADQQSSSPLDSQITLKIRQQLMRDNTMSSYGQNIKVITVKGRVTLKGPVRSAAEKNRIAKYAAALAGEANVYNELDVVDERSN